VGWCNVPECTLTPAAHSGSGGDGYMQKYNASLHEATLRLKPNDISIATHEIWEYEVISSC